MAWICYSVLATSQANTTKSIQKGIYRLTGTFAGAIIGTLLCKFVFEPYPKTMYLGYLIMIVGFPFIFIQYAIYITFGSVIITSNGGSSAMGDPYINPVLGNMYKMPCQRKIYRFISDNVSSLSNHKFVINASVTSMSSSISRDVINYMKSKFKDHVDYRKLRSSIILNGYYFNKFLIHNSTNEIILDLDKLTLHHHSGLYNLKTITNQRLVPLDSNIPSNREFNITVNNNNGSKVSLEPYVDEIYTKEIVIETSSLAYGQVQIRLYVFDNPQIRTGIRFTTDTNINQFNSAGLIVKYTDLNDLIVPAINNLDTIIYKELSRPVVYRNEIFYRSNNTSYQKTFIT